MAAGSEEAQWGSVHSSAFTSIVGVRRYSAPRLLLDERGFGGRCGVPTNLKVFSEEMGQLEEGWSKDW